MNAFIACDVDEAAEDALADLVESVGEVVSHVLLLLALELGDRLLEELEHRVVLRPRTLQCQELPQVLTGLMQIQLTRTLLLLHLINGVRGL